MTDKTLAVKNRSLIKEKSIKITITMQKKKTTILLENKIIIKGKTGNITINTDKTIIVNLIQLETEQKSQYQ